MGKDIHMFIVKDNEILAKEIFDGRNSEWFCNMAVNNCGDDCYEYLPVKYSWKDNVPEELSKKYNQENDYFDFRSVKVEDFKDWFYKYRPDIDAGWVTTYDKWRIEKKGYVPWDIKHYLDEDDDLRDMHFIEVSNPYDCSNWLCNYLVDNKVPNDADIIYCFDW